jgi:hypothetical protein
MIEIFKHLPDTNLVTMAISIASMLVMFLVRFHVNERFRHRLKVPIPVELIVVSN